MNFQEAFQTTESSPQCIAQRRDVLQGSLIVINIDLLSIILEVKQALTASGFIFQLKTLVEKEM